MLLIKLLNCQMFLRTLFIDNSFYLFFYLVLITGLFLILFSSTFKQLQTTIKREQNFNNLQTLIQNQKKVTFENYVELANLLLNRKLYIQAIKYFKLAIYDCDDLLLLGNIYNNIGYCYFKQKNFSEAKLFYNEAILYLPDYVVALNNLAYLFEQEKDYQSAYIFYNKSYQFDKSNTITIKQYQRIKKIVNVV